MGNTFFQQQSYMNKKYKLIIFLSSSNFLLRMSQQLMQKMNPPPIGLPNMGNTCFLNSILQQLYAIPGIRRFFQSLHCKTHENGSMIYLLKNLFSLMSSKKPTQVLEIQRNLQQIVKKLETEVSNYSKGQQYDSFQVFQNILNTLFEKDHNLKLPFEIEYSLKCKCPIIDMKFRQIKIKNHNQICSECQRPLKRNIYKFPRYLILLGGSGNEIKKYFSKYYCIYYKVQSQNVYYGSGYSGHYFSICYYNRKAFTFNDSSVFPFTYFRERERLIFEIYQKCSKQQFEMQDLIHKPPQTSQKKKFLYLFLGFLFVLVIWACKSCGERPNKSDFEETLRSIKEEDNYSNSSKYSKKRNHKAY